MPRKPRSKSTPTTSNDFIDAVNFVSRVCSDKGPINETHIYLGGNWAAASNGILTIACPIKDTIQVCPQSKSLVEALNKCGQEYSIDVAQNITIKSKKFKAVIPCIHPDLLSITTPNEPSIDINDKIKIALETVGVLVNENAQQIYGASILLNGQSVVATENGTILIEYWHGLNLPFNIAVPKNIVKALSGISKKLVKFGYSDLSVTFYFEDDSWIKTQLFAEKWPDITGVLDKPSNQLPLPKDFWEGVDAVAPFSPDGLIYFKPGMLHSHNTEGVGASFDVAGLPGGPSFSLHHLAAMRPLADTVDWFTADGLGTMLTFQGKNCRGAIAGRSK